MLQILKKIKHLKYKQIKSYKSASDSNEFAKIIDSYKLLCESIHIKYNEFRKKIFILNKNQMFVNS